MKNNGCAFIELTARAEVRLVAKNAVNEYKAVRDPASIVVEKGGCRVVTQELRIMSEATWLLHLSDIHFNKPESARKDPYDLDVDLRDQLELDVTRLRDRVGRIDGVVISGDIAFAGLEAEYDLAFEWLVKLTSICGCTSDKVWCVPGNHDVDLTVRNNSLMFRNLQESIRSAGPDKVDEKLGEALRDGEAANALLRPLETYNMRFAAKFYCRTAPTELCWLRELPLNDGSRLVFRGANSVLVSDLSDNNRDRKLVLGTLQATARERPDEVVVFICHHPLDWLVDSEKVLPYLSRARLQLFGHKHVQTIDHTNNSLRIVAGAVHPNRREQHWRPRYNLFGLSVLGDSEGRRLSVDLFPRVWAEVQPRFEPDYSACRGDDHIVYQLKLDPWAKPATVALPVAKVEATAAIDPDKRAEDAMPSIKTLAYQFLSLSHLTRLEIALELDLLQEEDEGLVDADLLDRIVKRAVAKGKVSKLSALVEKRYKIEFP